MKAGNEGTPRTTVERTSDTEVVVTRTVNGPVHLVYKAYSNADLFRQWWVPRSLGMKLVKCDMDVRVGGGYRLEFDVGQPEPMPFFGTYLVVVPNEKLSWTNDEGGPGGPITTVEFKAKDGKTLVVTTEKHATKESLDAAGTGAQDAMTETYAQLDELLATMA